MSMQLTEFVRKWRAMHPNFTGSIEFHFLCGRLRDIKSHQNHPVPVEELKDGLQRRKERWEA